MNMNRRMFFKSMGAATVAAAPISSALANVVSPKKWDQTCEVLVIGAGAPDYLPLFRLKKAVQSLLCFWKKLPARS